MNLFQRVPLEVGCAIVEHIRDPRALRSFRESSDEAREIVDSCISKIQGPVSVCDLLALPSVSEVEGTISGNVEGDAILRQIRGSISLSAADSLLHILGMIYVRKFLYPRSRIEILGSGTISWDGSQGALTIVYPVSRDIRVKDGEVVPEDEGLRTRIEEALAKLTGGVQELTYFDSSGMKFEKFWDGINPLKLRKVTMNSHTVYVNDPFQEYLIKASNRFELRISTFQLSPLSTGSRKIVSDNWREGSGRGVSQIYGFHSTRYLQELYGLAVPSFIAPAYLQNVAHALKDLKVIFSGDPTAPRSRPSIPLESLTPEEQTRAQLFLNAFPSIPITFH